MKFLVPFLLFLTTCAAYDWDTWDDKWEAKCLACFDEKKGMCAKGKFTFVSFSCAPLTVTVCLLRSFIQTHSRSPFAIPFPYGKPQGICVIMNVQTQMKGCTFVAGKLLDYQSMSF